MATDLDMRLDGRTPGPWYVSLVEDRPSTGIWHCGPNAAWVEVTHLPTMISARAFGKSHHKAKQAAMNCCEMLIEESGVTTCQFPDRIPHPATSGLNAAAPDLLEAGKETEWFLAHYADYVASVPVDEIERHPYLPDLQEKLEMLRAALAKAKAPSRA